MKAEKWLGVGLLITIGTVVLGLLVLRLISGFGFLGMPVMGAPGNQGSFQNIFECDDSRYSIGSGMMRFGVQNSQCDISTTGPSDDTVKGDISDDCISGTEEQPVACPGQIILPPNYDDGRSLSINAAHEIVEEFLINLDDDRLEIGEVMEFEKNFYAIVIEEETGTGAMELLIDKLQGNVNPEMGPNMMWNAKYGMRGSGGMMGNRNGVENKLTEDEVINLAQNWLDDNDPGISIDEHADPFYGYYTIHTIKDGVIEGMLSVHGITGQVWYHSWHGEFVQMLGSEDEH